MLELELVCGESEENSKVGLGLGLVRGELYFTTPDPHLVLPCVLTPRGISEDNLLCRLEHSFTAQPELVQLDISFPVSQIPATDESGDACIPFSPCKHARLTVVTIMPVHRVSGSWCSCQREHNSFAFRNQGQSCSKENWNWGM